jgi:hypothetical protein
LYRISQKETFMKHCHTQYEYSCLALHHAAAMSSIPSVLLHNIVHLKMLHSTIIELRDQLSLSNVSRAAVNLSGIFESLTGGTTTCANPDDSITAPLSGCMCTGPAAPGSTVHQGKPAEGSAAVQTPCRQCIGIVVVQSKAHLPCLPNIAPCRQSAAAAARVGAAAAHGSNVERFSR